jgi:hypothetical protein
LFLTKSTTPPFLASETVTVPSRISFGGNRSARNVRVVAATNRIRETDGTGEFRDDLYYRLKVIEIIFRHCVNVGRHRPARELPQESIHAAWQGD